MFTPLTRLPLSPSPGPAKTRTPPPTPRTPEPAPRCVRLPLKVSARAPVGPSETSKRDAESRKVPVRSMFAPRPSGAGRGASDKLLFFSFLLFLLRLFPVCRSDAKTGNRQTGDGQTRGRACFGLSGFFFRRFSSARRERPSPFTEQPLTSRGARDFRRKHGRKRERERERYTDR